MKKEATVHHIPTDKPEEWWKHLYITTDDEIKEGDWCLFFWDGMKDGELGQVGSEPQQYFPSKGHTLNRNLRKIIAATDPELVIRTTIPAGEDYVESTLRTYVPQIPQSFIESYCKNPVDKVMVEYEVFGYTASNTRISMDNTNIEIPNSGYDKRTYKLKLTSNNEIIIHPIEEKMYTKEEVEQLCRKAYEDGFYEGGLKDSPCKDPIFWIKENL